MREADQPCRQVFKLNIASRYSFEKLCYCFSSSFSIFSRRQNSSSIFLRISIAISAQTELQAPCVLFCSRQSSFWCDISHFLSVNNCALKAALYSRSPHAIFGMGTLDDLMFSFHLWLIAALPYRFHMVNKVNLPITAPNLPQRLE